MHFERIEAAHEHNVAQIKLDETAAIGPPEEHWAFNVL